MHKELSKRNIGQVKFYKWVEDRMAIGSANPQGSNGRTIILAVFQD